ncbi:MAG: restriction endonuclease [Pyrinomonadaceae bacterium]
MKKLDVTKSNHLLPFGELSPEQFERMSLWLVEREGYKRPEHLGEGGGDLGRDVQAYRPTDAGEELWFFQCKRYRTLGATKLISEVEKYNVLATTDPAKKPHGIVFVTNATVSAHARDKVREFCRKHGYASEFWARTELDLLVKKHTDIVAEFFNLTLPPQPHGTVSIARLPTTGSNLFGRDAELKMLDDAWADAGTNVIAFVAWGGVGKTALINHWVKRRLARENYRGAERVYAWSFYSQGTRERAASADLFIDQALRWFGDPEPTRGSPWDKGERLASFIRQARTLLILDGLEPLQYPPGTHEGRLKDAALQSLLVELAASQPGLCVISTRERVGDLVEFENSTVVQHELEHLTPQASAQLLRAQRIVGEDGELEKAAAEYGGHALALTLLGGYLTDVCGGDIRRRDEIGSLEEDARQGRHAERVMRAYEKWLGDGAELAVLRLMGFFDRPADAASIAALRAAPAIPELTVALQNLKGYEWRQALAKLRRIRLLGPATPNDPNALDAHPLVREHFKQQLKRERPDAWHEANNRLYEHLKLFAKEYPDTLEEMSPLYAAVAHGCAADRHKEALDLYEQRIQRGNEHFNWHKLGAYGADLATLAGFFETPWKEVVGGLTDDDKAYVLGEAGMDLRALGRLHDAAQTTELGLSLCIKGEDWINAATIARNLSQICLTMGDLRQALTFAQEGVVFADRSGDKFEQIVERATLADVLHQAGRVDEAAAFFREAEDLQQRWRPEHPFLFSLQGYLYCELLLGQGRTEEVRERSSQVLESSTPRNVLLAKALDDLSMGCASLLNACQSDVKDMSQAAEFLHRAVEGLRHAGLADHLPRGLLARARLYRLRGEFKLAKRDLAEVLSLASRGEMGLYLVDYHLESARLRLAQDELEESRCHLAEAEVMIKRMGYYRRDEEVTDIANQLCGLIIT